MNKEFKETQENWKNGSKNAWETIAGIYIGFCVVVISILLIFKIFIAPNIKMPKFFENKPTTKKENTEINKNIQSTSSKKNISGTKNKSLKENIKVINSEETNFNSYIPDKAEIKQQEKQIEKLRKEELKEIKKQQKMEKRQQKKEAKELKKAEKQRLKDARKAKRSNDDNVNNNVPTEDD